jgi:hypothetical protein
MFRVERMTAGLHPRVGKFANSLYRHGVRPATRSGCS